MKYPEVICTFEPGMDCPINTKVLRAIFRIIGVKYDPESDSFTAHMDWNVNIYDQHDNEDLPHYMLAVGENLTPVNEKDEVCSRSYRVRYCDYLSEALSDNEDVGEIKNNPGEWTIVIVLPSDKEGMCDQIAREINEAYEQAMIDSLPEYEILTSELMPNDNPQ